MSFWWGPFAKQERGLVDPKFGLDSGLGPLIPSISMMGNVIPTKEDHYQKNRENDRIDTPNKDIHGPKTTFTPPSSNLGNLGGITDPKTSYSSDCDSLASAIVAATTEEIASDTTTSTSNRTFHTPSPHSQARILENALGSSERLNRSLKVQIKKLEENIQDCNNQLQISLQNNTKLSCLLQEKDHHLLLLKSELNFMLPNRIHLNKAKQRCDVLEQEAVHLRTKNRDLEEQIQHRNAKLMISQNSEQEYLCELSNMKSLLNEAQRKIHMLDKEVEMNLQQIAITSDKNIDLIDKLNECASYYSKLQLAKKQLSIINSKNVKEKKEKEALIAKGEMLRRRCESLESKLGLVPKDSNSHITGGNAREHVPHNCSVFSCIPYHTEA